MSGSVPESFFQQYGQVMHVVIGAMAVRHEGPDSAAPVDQIGERGVLVRVAAADYLLFGGHTVALADCRQLLLRPGAADEGWIERAEILLESSGVVPLWIHRDVDYLNIGGGRGELAACHRESVECGWAHGCARSKAECQQHHLAAIVADSQAAAVGSVLLEVRRRAGWVERANQKHQQHEKKSRVAGGGESYQDHREQH